MKKLVLLLALFIMGAVVQAQVTQTYQLSKYIYNGTSAYTTGEVIGGSPDSLDMWPSGAFGVQNPSKWAYLQNLTLLDSLAQNASIEAWIMDTRTAALSDGATFALSWADLQHVVSVIPFGNVYYASSPGSVNVEPNINIMLRAPITSYINRQAPRYLWVYFVCRSSKTWTVANTLRIRLQWFWW